MLGLWLEDISLYFDYKIGRLTRSELAKRLSAIRAEFDGEPGTKLTNGEVYRRFIEEWERVYSGNVSRRVMEGAWHKPEGTPFLPGLRPEHEH